MNDDQVAAGFRAFARRRPFREFRIDFVDGRQIPIKHPEAVAPMSGVWVYRAPPNLYVVFSSSAVCRLSDVDVLG